MMGLALIPNGCIMWIAHVQQSLEKMTPVDD